MSDNKDVIRRIRDAKTKPEYQRLDIEPNVGGRQLLHDEFGKINKGRDKRDNIPQLEEIGNEPVMVKAAQPNKVSFRKPMTKVNKVEDDGFIPPKDNFVSVGNVEHAWYDEKVTGPSIDNNEVVDVEKLQGINPLSVSDSKVLEFFTKRLAYVKSFVLNELADIVNEQEIAELKAKVFGKTGIFTEILKKLGSVQPNDRAPIGELVNQTYSDIQLEIEGKMYELQSEAEEDEDMEWPEEMAVIEKNDDENNEVEENVEESVEENDGIKEEQTIPEGHYAVIMDGSLVEVLEDDLSAKNYISNLILNENVDLKSIQLIKRIKIDFGLILD
jgi:hypothetical protein